MRSFNRLFAAVVAGPLLGAASASGAIVTGNLTFNWDGATAIAGEAWQSSSPASDTTATWATGGLTLNTATGSSTTLSQAWTFTP
ncbi:MAG: hypothetical protein AAGE65_06645, partial [Planctomycetota bacterium]